MRAETLDRLRRWRGLDFLEIEMARSGFSVPSIRRSAQATILKREGALPLDLDLHEFWRELTREYFESGFAKLITRPLDRDGYRSQFIDRLCDGRSPGWLSNVLSVLSGWDPALSPEANRARQSELAPVVDEAKSREIAALGLEDCRSLKEEGLIVKFYKVADAAGWTKTDLKHFGLHRMRAVLSPSRHGVHWVLAMEHSMTNLQFGILPLTFGMIVDGEVVGGDPRIMLNGLAAYDRFRDGAEAVLGMRAHLELGECLASAIR